MKSHGIELQCNHDQLVCPMQSITCQCVVMGEAQILTWTSQSQVIAQFGAFGQTLIPLTNTAYTVTVEELENEVSSNLSFTAQLYSDLVTIQCLDFNENYFKFSYSIVGGF